MILTYDHETYPIERARLAPPIVCTSWAVDHEPVRLELWRDTPMRDLLRSASMIDGANTAYDLTCDMATDPEVIPDVIDAYVQGRVRDVQLDWRLWDIQRGIPIEGRSYSLETLAAHLNIAMRKDDGWRLRYGELDGIPIAHWPQGAIEYSLYDTEVTRKVRQALPSVQPQHIYQLAAGADWALHLMSCWGIHTDPKRVELVAERVTAHIASMEGRLIEAGLVRRDGTKEEIQEYGRRLRAAARERGVDPRILKQEWTALGNGEPDGGRSDLAAAARMIQVMTAQGRRQNIALSDSGEVLLRARVERGEDRATVREELLAKVVRGRSLVKLDADAATLSGDELLMIRAEWTSSNRLLGRVQRLREGYVLPLQTSFDSVKETFRTSSRQPSPPLVGEQMQNFDRGEEGELGLREGFTPRPGYVFIGGDIGQAELCSLAELLYKLFGHTRLGEILNANIDAHWYLAASSLGMLCADLDQIRASIVEVKKLGKKHRGRAKPGNFGFPGGMGPEKFILYSRKGYGVFFTLDEAKEAKAKWLAAYPEMNLYLDWISKQCGKRGNKFEHVHPITGYRRGGCGYTDGANHGFQHLTAVATKACLVQVARECYDPRLNSPLFGSRCWDFIHDEILLESPIDRASEAAERLGQLMESVYNEWTPTYPTKVVPWVSSVWFKDIEPVRDDHGRLVDAWLNRDQKTA